jgi:transmembrane protein 132
VANDTKEHWDGARIVWSVSYVHDGPKSKDISAEIQPNEESRKKLIAKLEIQKDDIQSVLPISKVCVITIHNSIILFLYKCMKTVLQHFHC